MSETADAEDAVIVERQELTRRIEAMAEQLVTEWETFHGLCHTETQRLHLVSLIQILLSRFPETEPGRYLADRVFRPGED